MMKLLTRSDDRNTSLGILKRPLRWLRCSLRSAVSCSVLLPPVFMA